MESEVLIKLSGNQTKSSRVVRSGAIQNNIVLSLCPAIAADIAFTLDTLLIDLLSPSLTVAERAERSADH